MEKLNLPTPPLSYSAELERERNRRISEYLGGKVDKDELPTFLGVPFILASGSNAAFSAPNAATTQATFDTLITNRDLTGLNLTSNQVVPVFTTDAEVDYNFYHAAGGVTIDVNFTISCYVNGVLVNSQVQKKGFNDNFNLMGTFVVIGVPKGQGLDIRVAHDYTSPVAFDLTKSRLYFKRLSYNPIYKRSRL